MSASTGGAGSGEGSGEGSAARVALAWALVGVPLAYGVVETLVRASRLFGG
ncbi:MFS transporter small subunit [Kineococcus sp. SYSU DK018]|uniref:MFS transporter small subunit n=1 Tax=Kineococcus sp. SYSU DK018 TaxID=3383139 RepID=UPI003D7D1580